MAMERNGYGTKWLRYLIRNRESTSSLGGGDASGSVNNMLSSKCGAIGVIFGGNVGITAVVSREGIM
jgi:hypothetical protein